MELNSIDLEFEGEVLEQEEDTSGAPHNLHPPEARISQPAMAAPDDAAHDFVDDDRTGLDPHHMDADGHDEELGVNDHHVTTSVDESDRTGVDMRAAPEGDLDADDMTGEEHPSLGTESAVEDDRTDPAGAMHTRPQTEAEPAVTLRDMAESAGAMHTRPQTEAEPAVTLRDMSEPAAAVHSNMAAPAARDMAIESSKPARDDATLPSNSPFFQDAGQDVPAAPARPALAKARPGLRSKAKGRSGAGSDEGDATVPHDKQGLPLPASLPVLADDGVDPSPEYVAAREAALRAVRAQKQLHGQAPVPFKRSGSVPSQFGTLSTGTGHTGTGTGPGSSPFRSFGTGPGSSSGTGPGHRPARHSTPIRGDDQILERSYTDALAAIDLADDVDDIAPLEQSSPGMLMPAGQAGSSASFGPATQQSYPGAAMPGTGAAEQAGSSASFGSATQQSYPGAAMPGTGAAMPGTGGTGAAMPGTGAAMPGTGADSGVAVPEAPWPAAASQSGPYGDAASQSWPEQAPGYTSQADRAQAVPPQGLADIYDDDEDALPPSARLMSPQPSSHWVPNPKRPRRIKRPRGPAPGHTNAKIAFERNPIRIGFGVIIMSAGLVLLLWFLPSHAPKSQTPPPRDTAAETTDAPEPYVWRYTPSLYRNARFAAMGFVAVGILFLLNGIYFKPRSEIVCKRCKRYVIAQRDMINLKCPRSSHVAGLCYTTVVLTAMLLACVAATLFMVAEANIIRGG